MKLTRNQVVNSPEWRKEGAKKTNELSILDAVSFCSSRLIKEIMEVTLLICSLLITEMLVKDRLTDWIDLQKEETVRAVNLKMLQEFKRAVDR